MLPCYWCNRVTETSKFLATTVSGKLNVAKIVSMWHVKWISNA